MILLAEFLVDLQRPALWSIIGVLFFFSVFFWRMFVREKRRHESDSAAAVDLSRQLADTEAQNGNLLKENERLKEECDQHRIVIEVAKEERLALLKQQAIDGNALSAQRGAIRDANESLKVMAEKVAAQAKDIDARSRVMIQQIDLIEKYRQLNETLISSGQHRGAGGRFVKKADAATA